MSICISNIILQFGGHIYTLIIYFKITFSYLDYILKQVQIKYLVEENTWIQQFACRGSSVFLLNNAINVLKWSQLAQLFCQIGK